MRITAKRQDAHRGSSRGNCYDVTDMEVKVLANLGDGAVYGDPQQRVPAFGPSSPSITVEEQVRMQEQINQRADVSGQIATAVAGGTGLGTSAKHTDSHFGGQSATAVPDRTGQGTSLRHTASYLGGILRGLPRRRLTGSGTLEHASSRAWYLLNPRCDTYRWAYRVSLDKPTNMSSD
ncbi:hypothetical protein EVAR_59591_1 [Eumeta japonica]|uniref:Uncharacterized protein n=1 Tax=Eumeta variegata TaxID=151549 RepID=A0A4C1Z5N6_EUMVA|nr:hypothetical protein EVAR_59591_1 [Eumeta japonica]